ncbi:MAG: YkgJ family cysteine cluster protein, partial [Nitrospina sp.]|nr:YkgJ family cysteine cluster protein [Nitrospina sp.]
MELKSDARGLFIEGMTDSTELSSYLQRKFKDEDIQNTYESLTKNHIKTARSQDITPLSKFWQTLDESYKKIPPLKC